MTARKTSKKQQKGKNRRKDGQDWLKDKDGYANNERGKVNHSMILPTSCLFSFAGRESHLQTGYNYLPESNVWWKIRQKNKTNCGEKRSCKHLKKSGMLFRPSDVWWRKNTDTGPVNFCTFWPSSRLFYQWFSPLITKTANKIRWNVNVKSRDCACVDNMILVPSVPSRRAFENRGRLHVGFTCIFSSVDCGRCHVLSSFF